jgi:hypothetical protein
VRRPGRLKLQIWSGFTLGDRHNEPVTERETCWYDAVLRHIPSYRLFAAWYLWLPNLLVGLDLAAYS